MENVKVEDKAGCAGCAGGYKRGEK